MCLFRSTSYQLDTNPLVYPGKRLHVLEFFCSPSIPRDSQSSCLVRHSWQVLAHYYWNTGMIGLEVGGIRGGVVT